MIGKIIVITILVLVFVAYTGVNAVPYYQDYTSIRDQTQPIADKVIEKILNVVSHSDLKAKIQEMTGRP